MTLDYLIRLPQLGLTMTEGMMVEWMVTPGAAVRAGDVLYVVETDKIANEILADRDGVLESILVQVDETVPVGTILGTWVGAPKTNIKKQSGTRIVESRTKTSKKPPADATKLGKLPTIGERIIASPHARKLAREYSIDLSKLSGSGPHGRIVAKDIHNAVTTSNITSTPVTENSTENLGSGTPLRGVQKIVAAQMLRSHTEIPHFHLTASAEISELLWLHEGLKQKPEIGRITLTHWIASAVGLAIADTPKFRTVLVNERLFVLPGSSVGIAVAIEDGIHAPVATNLGDHGLTANAVKIEELVTQAREGTLGPDSSIGAAITVTNLGSFNIDHVLPLIVPGQSSTLGVGRQQSVFRPDADGAPMLRK
ncbi:MAG TPA: hypothetical protein DGR97_12010, partial [Gammaproteobacteria bacterium]|nr:hypothetical protein [Gammaproteobacteria bacterium]